MRKFLAISVVAAGAALSFASPASADPKGWVQICHGTASEKNPYVTIVTGASSVNGHFDDGAPGHGQNNNPDKLKGTTNTPGQGHGGGDFGPCQSSPE